MTERLPAFLIAYSDSSFTNPHEVVRPDEPPDCTGNFTHMGAKYWGFETRRHRATQLDDREDLYHFDDDAFHWLHIGLKQPARVSRITISTRWFTGNQVPEVSVELLHAHTRTEVIGRTSLPPDGEREFEFDTCLASECLVRCYHEGGIARISFYGEAADGEPTRINLLAGASISHVSNEHYGKPGDAVTGERQVDHMLGWESARSGFGEHALFHLDEASSISGVIVDTYLHRLNPPLSCHIFGFSGDAEAAWAQRPRWRLEFTDGLSVTPDDLPKYMNSRQFLKENTESPSRFDIILVNPAPESWLPVLSFGRLRPDTWHHFQELENTGPFSHILYMHFPNGGIHGLNIYR